MSKDAAVEVSGEDTPDLQVGLEIDSPADNPREDVEGVGDCESEHDPQGYGFGV